MVDNATTGDAWAGFLAASDAVQLAAVLSAAEIVVAEVGETYVYPYESCRYTTAALGLPGSAQPCACIAGRILFRLGAPLSLLRSWDDMKRSDIGHVLNMDAPQVGTPARQALVRMQREQDGASGDRMTWGHALRTARTLANRIDPDLLDAEH